jgi:hypothetical protein
MKRALMVGVAIFLSVGFFSANQLHAAKKKSGSALNAEEAGVRLLAMQQKGYVQLVLIDPNPLLYVEPLAWKNLTHRDKVDLGTLALLFVNGLKKEKNLKYQWVFIKDMTTKDSLGTVHLNENRVEIFK